MIELTQSQIMQNWGCDNSDVPLVSVRCITYNHEPYIAQALDGFLMQKTNFPFEVIVHDDASTDKTANIIREYEKKFPKIIKPIYETENQYSKHDGSLSRIVNAALKGKYVAMCEGDDYWIDENKLQMQVDFLEKHGDVSATYHNCELLFQGEISKEDKIGKEKKHPHRKTGFYTLSEFSKDEAFPGQLASLVVRHNICDIVDDKKNILNLYPINGDVKYIAVSLVFGKVFVFENIMSVYRIVMNFGNSWSARTKNLNLRGDYLLRNIGIKKYIESESNKKFYNDRSIFIESVHILLNALFLPHKNNNKKVFNEVVKKLGGVKQFYLTILKSGINVAKSVFRVS